MKPALPARRERGGGGGGGGKAGGRKESLKEVKKEKKEAVVVGARKEGTGMGPRKSRSKERPRANNNNNGSSEVLFLQSVTLSSVIWQRQSLSDYERIKEREKELERIHRRSRSLVIIVETNHKI